MPQFQLEILLNSEDVEALRAKEHKYKRIIKLLPFWNMVY